jgi:hypothetical protein
MTLEVSQLVSKWNFSLCHTSALLKSILASQREFKLQRHRSDSTHYVYRKFFLAKQIETCKLKQVGNMTTESQDKKNGSSIL